MGSAQTVLQSYRSFKVLLTGKQKLRTRIIAFWSTLIAFADIVGLSSMVPVLMLAIDHSFLEKSSKLRHIYSYFQFTSEAGFLKALIVFILLFFLLKSVAALWLYRYVRKTAADIAMHLSALSYRYAFKHNTYEKVASDGLGFNDMVLFTPYYFVSGIYLPFLNIISEVSVVFMLVLVFTVYKPVLFFLIVGLLGSAFYLVNRTTRRKITTLGEETQAMRQAALTDLNLGISGFTDIRAHGVESYFQRRFMEHFTGFARSGIKAVSYQLIPARINEVVALIGIIVLVVYGYFYSGENLGVVRVLAALFAISVFRLIPAANRLLQALMHLKLSHYTIHNLLPIASDSDGTNDPLDTFHKTIELKEINFGYENSDTPVFEHMNFEIQKGEIIGISGPSGSGKTTFAKILLGFHQPNSGSIWVDGVKQEHENALQKMFGYMGQEPFILNATVRENIALGIVPEMIDEARVQQCIMDAAFMVEGKVNLADLATGEGGAMLSEGQKQRLVLARELYRDAPVIILDEPTSALDSVTENEVMDTLRMLGKSGKTLIIIAHRERILELCTSVYQMESKSLKKIR